MRREDFVKCEHGGKFSYLSRKELKVWRKKKFKKAKRACSFIKEFRVLLTTYKNVKQVWFSTNIFLIKLLILFHYAQVSLDFDYMESNCASDPVSQCQFRPIRGQILKTVDSVYQNVNNLDGCRELCINADYRYIRRVEFLLKPGEIRIQVYINFRNNLTTVATDELLKCGCPDLIVFHLKWIIDTRCNWKKSKSYQLNSTKLPRYHENGPNGLN